MAGPNHNATLSGEGAEQSKYVTLVSADGFEFHVRRSAAEASVVIKRMLDPNNNAFSESKNNRCKFENLSGVVLEVVCEYFYYFEKYKDAKDVPEMDIPKELVLELVLAADYLQT